MEGHQMIFVTFVIEVETELLTEKEHSKVIPLSEAQMAVMRATKMQTATFVNWNSNMALNRRGTFVLVTLMWLFHGELSGQQNSNRASDNDIVDGRILEGSPGSHAYNMSETVKIGINFSH